MRNFTLNSTDTAVLNVIARPPESDVPYRHSHDDDDVPVLQDNPVAAEVFELLIEHHYKGHAFARFLELYPQYSGGIEDLRSVIKTISDKLGDPYIRLLNPVEARHHDLKASGTNPITNVKYKAQSNTIDVGDEQFTRIEIPKFCKGMTEQVRKRIRRVGARRNAGMMIDVRKNPGGYAEVADSIASLLVHSDQLYEELIGDELRPVESSVPLINAYTPVVVLTDSVSASSSAIFAGIIQTHRRGIVVGDKTSPKNTSQRRYKLKKSKQMQLKISTHTWQLNGDKNIADTGGLEADFSPSDLLQDNLPIDPNMLIAIRKVFKIPTVN